MEEGRIKVKVGGLLSILPGIRSAVGMIDGQIPADVQPDVRELDRDVRPQALRLDPVEHLAVGGDDRAGLRLVAYALAEQRRVREEAALVQPPQDRDRVVERFACDEPRGPEPEPVPLLVRRVFELVQQIHREGATILLVEQNAKLALSVSDHAYVLERGRVVLEGVSSELARDPRVQAAYLGGETGEGQPRFDFHRLDDPHRHRAGSMRAVLHPDLKGRRHLPPRR